MNTLIVVGLCAMLVVIGVSIFRAANSSTGQNPPDPQFNYDLSVVRKTDPALVKYEQIASFPTGLDDAKAIRGNDNELAVAGGQGAKGAIRVFSNTGQFKRQIDFDEPVSGMASDGVASIYAAVGSHVEIVVGDKPVLGWIAPAAKAVLTSIAVHVGKLAMPADGSPCVPLDIDVFVADAGNRCVWHYDGAGKLLGKIEGTAGPEGNRGFVVPSPYFCVAIGQDGLLRVANPGRHRIETYTFDGRAMPPSSIDQQSWGKFGVDIEGFCGCCNPVSFAILPNGGFVTAEKGLPRVKIYNPAGDFECVVVGADSFPVEYACINKGLEGCKGGGMDVAVDKEGRIYVLEPHEKKVYVYARKDAATTKATTTSK